MSSPHRQGLSRWSISKTNEEWNIVIAFVILEKMVVIVVGKDVNDFLDDRPEKRTMANQRRVK